MKSFLYLIIFVFYFQFSFAQLKHGPYVEYYDNGQIRIEGLYKNSKRYSVWKEYFKNGQISKIYIYDDSGKKKEERIDYFETGETKKVTKKEDAKFITREYYNSGELLAISEFENGYYKEFTKDSTLLIEANYVNSELSGVWKRYYEDGVNEWIVHYEDGYKNGTYQNFYKNGQLKLEGYIINDKKQGKERRYYENGNLEWEGVYKQDILDKLWIHYDENNNILEQIKFKKGKILDENIEIDFLSTIVPNGHPFESPIYPGCEDVLGQKNIKKCLSDSITSFVKKSFKTSLAGNLGLTGRQRINVLFKIDAEGNVTDVEAKAPHPRLYKEAIRVIDKLPKMIPAKVKR